MKLASLLLLNALFFLSAATVEKHEVSSQVIIEKMLKELGSYKGVQFKMHSIERLKNNGGLKANDMFSKLKVQPHCIYSKVLSGDNAGTELLFAEGERKNKVLVNAGKYIPNLDFSPFGSTMAKNQHHTLLCTGFDHIYNILTNAHKKALATKNFEAIFKFEGEVVWNNVKCYKMLVIDPNFTSTTYQSKTGETVFSISKKLLIPEYSILELNIGIKYFDEDLGARKLKVPSSYAKTTILYINQQNYYPIFQQIYDDKGLFEQYEFSQLVVNPSFKPDEFTSSFKEYGF
jgi:hypothetical protein